ncbi:hypothetical protein OSB04_023977 [Centaurea solstitialis]|uniref:Uncharacterized protein n=1 Tax=Centaurea solstitialis TaxID=347529 RepID=A0AA38SXL5_9ASTR|nr:hypothetical protein OSB04_023977 [Centaurea solstitialis]
MGVMGAEPVIQDCYFENQSDQKERKHLHEEKKKVVFGGDSYTDGMGKRSHELPSELSQMHNTCNVSWSKKYLVDVSSRDILTAFRLLNDLTVERSIAILERYTKSLRIKEIVMANVQWDQEMTQNSIKNRKWR